MEFEAEVLAGLEPFAAAELRAAGAARVQPAKGGVRCEYRGRVAHLLGLRTAVAVYSIDSFAVPRPKALLGEQHLRCLVERLERVRTLGTFESFRFSAAGRESAVFSRLADEIGARTGLTYDPDQGDLVLRVRPAAGGDGWEVLCRLTPRPLSARGWRLRDRRGALNATIAAAMVELSEPASGDRVLNLACGTGTLLAERLAAGPVRVALGLDNDAGPLEDAATNLAAAGVLDRVTLVRADAGRLPVRDSSFDVALADLPYGSTVGSPEGNERLYPAVLAAAAAAVRPDGRFVVITHDLRRFEALLAGQQDWRVEQDFQVFQKGHHPKVWLLRRT